MKVSWILSIIIILIASCVLIKLWHHFDKYLCGQIIPCKEPCVVEADPDIVGIGVSSGMHEVGQGAKNSIQVRLGTYIQSISGTILLRFSSDDTKNVRATIAITSLTIAISTGVFAPLEKLSFEHVAMISSLLTVSICPMHLNEPWRVQSPGLFTAQQIRLFSYGALQLWLVLKATCLGSEPQCNLCTKTYIFVKEHTAGPGRRALEAFLRLCTINDWFRDLVWREGPFNYVKSVPALFSQTHRDAWLAHETGTHAERGDLHSFCL